VDSIKGYRKIPDKAWFLHPIICFGILFVYSLGVIQNLTASKER